VRNKHKQKQRRVRSERELGIGGRHLSRLGRRLFDIIHKLHKIDLYIFIFLLLFEYKNNNKQRFIVIRTMDFILFYFVFFCPSTNSQLNSTPHHITLFIAVKAKWSAILHNNLFDYMVKWSLYAEKKTSLWWQSFSSTIFFRMKKFLDKKTQFPSINL
jgi:hypothetical protein